MRDNSQPLHIKYRPQNFSEVVGNESTIKVLQTIVSRKEGIPHAFLFTGPPGCGKTTTARILAKELKCSDISLSEVNVASARGIDTIREIANECIYTPLSGRTRVYILDEVARGTKDFQSSALKLLEDPPSHVYFILCTTDPDLLLKTIKTRCQKFVFSSLTQPLIMRLLKWVCREEKVELSQEVLKKIGGCCDGSPREALVLLDKVIDIISDEDALIAIANSLQEKSVLDLCRMLLMKSEWLDIAGLLKSIDEDPEKIRHGVGAYMSSVLLKSENPYAAIVLDVLANTNFIYSGRWGMVATFYTIFCSIRK